MTYCVKVNGCNWDNGLSRNLADAARELLLDFFPGAKVTIVQES